MYTTLIYVGFVLPKKGFRRACWCTCVESLGARLQYSTGMICICGPDKFHFLPTENVSYIFHDFGMLHTNGNLLSYFQLIIILECKTTVINC